MTGCLVRHASSGIPPGLVVTTVTISLPAAVSHRHLVSFMRGRRETHDAHDRGVVDAASPAKVYRLIQPDRATTVGIPKGGFEFPPELPFGRR